MADLQKLLAGFDKDQIEEMTSLLKKFAEASKDLSDSQILITQTAAKNLLNAKETIEGVTTNAGADLQKLIDETSKIQTAAAQARAQELKEIRDYVKGNQQLISDTMKAYTKDSNKLTTSLQKASKSTRHLSKEMLENARRLRETGKESREFSASVSDIIPATIGAGKALASFTSGLSTTSMAVLALTSRFNFDALQTRLKTLIVQLDVNFRNVIKKGTKDTARLNDSFTAAIDPITAVRQGFLGLGQASEMLTNVGITSAEASAALISLKDNAMAFRDGLEDTYPGITAYTTNLVAGMRKIGISTEASTKAIDTFGKSLKKTPKMATDSVKRLIKIADSLDINVGRAFNDFNANINTFIQFGDRAVDVFAGIEKQAVATGISVGDLAKAAEKLDTFKGAATAAQGFNAILGDTYLSMTDLVHATPEENST